MLLAYARAEGTGAAFNRTRSATPMVLATCLLAAALVATAATTLAAGGAGGWWAGLLVTVVAMGVALVLQAAVARRLGGLTGDVYGMGIELAEAAALLVGCAIVRLAS